MRRELDVSLLIAVVMMVAFGVTMIYSAATGSARAILARVACTGL